jgi:PAS domain S-box-containing protein
MIGSSEERFLSMEGFISHGTCSRLQPSLTTVDLLSDGLIALAYLSLAATMFYFVRSDVGAKHRKPLLGFALFNVACGVIHLLAIGAAWHPHRWFGYTMEACTALASALVALFLIKSLPVAPRDPTSNAIGAMQGSIAVRKQSTDRNDRIQQLEVLNRNLVEDAARSAIAADAAGLGFWTFDVDADELHWDETMFRLFGISPTENQQPEVMLTSRAQLRARVNLDETQGSTVDGGRDYDTEFSAIHPSGPVRHLKAVARIIRDSDGRPLRMLGATFDITERKHSDEQFRLAIEAAPTGMLLTDLRGTIVLVNAQIEHLFGYLRSELLGRPIELLVPEGFHFNMSEFRQDSIKDLTTPLGKVTGLRKDGVEVPVEIGLNPLVTSEGQFVLSSIVDLSQRLEIDRIRNEFVSTVSHELRTPLTSIRGSLGLLQSGAMGALSSEAAEMVTIAYKNSGRLVRIINDILDIGTIDAGKLALQMSIVLLGDLLQQSVEDNAGFAEKCEVRFLLEPVAKTDRVMADPDRLMQVMVNLLSNAAKFSTPGGDVLIRVRPGTTTLRIEVEDSGAGIPESFKPHVFEKFAQADASASRRFAGTGLGLNIARKLVEAMGGSIGFYSAAIRGTIFFVELPRSDAAPATLRATQLSETAAYKMLLASAGSRAAAASGMPRLLYVEDDEDLISVIRAALLGRVEIVAARTFRDAAQLLQEQTFGLVVLDQALPDGDGLLLIDRIEAAHRVVPIIILSAVDVPRVVRSKVAEVLIKSQVSAAQVATTILYYLSRDVP